MFQRRSGGSVSDHPERAREAERKSGNSKNNSERAIEAGRTGGKISRRPLAEKAAP